MASGSDSYSDASRPLGLDALAVERVESDGFAGRLTHVVTADQTASACPRRGVSRSRARSVPGRGISLMGQRDCVCPAQKAVALHGTAVCPVFVHCCRRRVKTDPVTALGI